MSEHFLSVKNVVPFPVSMVVNTRFDTHIQNICEEPKGFEERIWFHSWENSHRRWRNKVVTK
jgi:hypothetical protein